MIVKMKFYLPGTERLGCNCCGGCDLGMPRIIIFGTVGITAIFIFANFCALITFMKSLN